MYTVVKNAKASTTCIATPSLKDAIFAQKQTVLLIRGVCQGKPTAKLARELGISRTTVTAVRHQLQANAEKEQPEIPLEDEEVETDEMFQNAGEKKRVAW